LWTLEIQYIFLIRTDCKCKSQATMSGIPKTRKLYSCSMCQKFFQEPSNLELHFRVHTGERPFQCGVCKLSFKSQGSVSRHLKVHTNERQFDCLFCKKPFKFLENLKKHIHFHTKEKDYWCSKCPRPGPSFASKESCY